QQGPGRVAFPQPILHFSLNRLLDVLADDACPGYFRYHRVPPSMPCSRTHTQSVSSGATVSAHVPAERTQGQAALPTFPGAGIRVYLRSMMPLARLCRRTCVLNARKGRQPFPQYVEGTMIPYTRQL